METQPKVSATEQFWTRPRTTNANWGIFFEIVAKDRPIWITGIHAGGHSFAAHDDYTRLKVRVLSAEGSAVGKELNEKAWTPVGEADNFKLPRVEVGEITPQYTPLPFSPVHIPANAGRAFCIHTNRKTGLALRRKLNFDSNNLQDPYFREWTDGVTDEGEHFKLIAGLVPGEKLFSEVSSSNNARAFVGVIEYQLTDPSK